MQRPDLNVTEEDIKNVLHTVRGGFLGYADSQHGEEKALKTLDLNVEYGNVSKEELEKMSADDMVNYQRNTMCKELDSTMSWLLMSPEELTSEYNGGLGNAYNNCGSIHTISGKPLAKTHYTGMDCEQDVIPVEYPAKHGLGFLAKVKGLDPEAPEEETGIVLHRAYWSDTLSKENIAREIKEDMNYGDNYFAQQYGDESLKGDADAYVKDIMGKIPDTTWVLFDTIAAKGAMGLDWDDLTVHEPIKQRERTMDEQSEIKAVQSNFRYFGNKKQDDVLKDGVRCDVFSPSEFTKAELDAINGYDFDGEIKEACAEKGIPEGGMKQSRVLIDVAKDNKSATIMFVGFNGIEDAQADETGRIHSEQQIGIIHDVIKDALRNVNCDEFEGRIRPDDVMTALTKEQDKQYDMYHEAVKEKETAKELDSSMEPVAEDTVNKNMSMDM